MAHEIRVQPAKSLGKSCFIQVRCTCGWSVPVTQPSQQAAARDATSRVSAHTRSTGHQQVSHTKPLSPPRPSFSEQFSSAGGLPMLAALAAVTFAVVTMITIDGSEDDKDEDRIARACENAQTVLERFEDSDPSDKERRAALISLYEEYSADCTR